MASLKGKVTIITGMALFSSLSNILQIVSVKLSFAYITEWFYFI